MSDENKEKNLPQNPESDNNTDNELKTDEKLTDSEQTAKAEQQSDDDGWDWEAAAPETPTDEIVVDELIPEMKTHDDSTENPYATDEEEQENETEVNNSKDESDDDGLCIVCGKKRGNSPSTLYCEECRAKFLKTNYGVGHIILAFVMVIVAAIGYFVCVSTCQVSDKLVKAQSYFNEKQYDNASLECSTITDTVSTLNTGVNALFTGINENFTSKDWFSEGSKATVIVLRSYAQTLTISYNARTTFVSAVEQTLTDKELNSPKYTDIKGCYDFCTEIEKFSEPISETWQRYAQGDGTDENYVIPYDKTMSYLDSTKPENDSQKSILAYYRFMTAYYANKDSKVILDYYKQAYELAGDYGFMFLQGYMGIAWSLEDYSVIPDLADAAMARNKNDTSAYYYKIKVDLINKKNDEALALCEQMKKNNPDGIDYYYMKAEVCRRSGKYEDAIKVCKEGLKAGSDGEIYRQEAIAYMLLENKTAAVEAAKSCYDITLQAAYGENGSLSVESMNTTALIMFLCGKNDTYEEICDLLKEQNYEIEDSVKKCINGDTTFEDLFMNGTGDV